MEARQVMFRDPEGNILGGIFVDDGCDSYIICGCCGGVFEYEEIGDDNIKFLPWTNIDEVIKGDEHFDSV
jgi:hypothetical protein